VLGAPLPRGLIAHSPQQPAPTTIATLPFSRS
jgi:hypothetical protein